MRDFISNGNIESNNGNIESNIRAHINALCKDLEIPYLDVICYQNHQEIFRHYCGENATGKELLYMYSCSKPITVVAALRLVEAGRLSLDDKACVYLPELKKAFYIDKNGEKCFVGEKITIRHLFTMTAGFSYDLGASPVLRLAKESRGQATLRDFIASYVETPLSFAPGSKFQYSICHDILAAVIEVASGKKFSTYIQEEIFTPLGMKRSYFDNSEPKVAEIYNVTESGEILKIAPTRMLLPTKKYESGGAGLVSTVEDYLIFADALACGGLAKNGYRILQEETVRALASLQINGLSVNNGFTCIQGDDYGYGLGVRVRQKSTDWGLEKGEFGWDGAAGSYVMIDSKRGVSVFIGMHLQNWPRVFTGKHLKIVKRIYLEFFNEGERICRE